ncbi:PAS domain S-box protein [Belliella sp. DSM 107340]|uniref:histidine kinase n=1 Tax=Belliella calami TaxID=2923436 RepID=A0ABS9UJV9_9BACT|nr:PAS domain S-box protein [Belliella calami]MCH7396720.1 PAS domain S-box protein [Belliella calami]
MDNKQYGDLLLNQTKDLIWMVDTNLILKQANPAYIKVIEQVSELKDIIEKPVLVEGFGDKKQLEKWRDFYIRALSGEYFEVEEHFYNPNTDQIHYNQITFTPINKADTGVSLVACLSRDITRIVREKSEANQLMDASLDVFCTLNEMGFFVFTNAATKNQWGFTPEELKGQLFWEHVVEEDATLTQEAFQSIISGQMNTFSNRYYKKDGSVAFNLWSARWDSKSQMMYCVGKDIREKIEQEAIIFRNKARFKALVQEGSDMIAILDSSGKYTYVSPTSTTVLGITPEAFMGKNAFEFIHPDDLEKTKVCLQNIANQPKVIIEPYRFKDYRGQWRWLETVLTNMLDNPAVNGFVANSRDITDKMEEAHKLKLFEKVINSTSDAIIIADAEPIEEPGPSIIFVNKAFTEMTGYTMDEVIGKNPRMLQGPDSSREDLIRLKEKLKQWESAEATLYNYKKSGKGFWINLAVSPVADHKGWFTHWISIQRDVTEQKNKEIEKELLSQISLNFSEEEELTSAARRLCQNLYDFGKFELIELWCPNWEQTELKLVGHFTTNNAFYESAEVRPFSKHTGLQGKVWQSGKQLLWDEKEIQKNFLRKTAASKLKLKSVLGVPLIFQNELNGVLLIGSKQEPNHLDKYRKIIGKLEEFIGSEINRKRLETNLSHIYNTIPDILCMLNYKGQFLKINKAGCNLLGYTEEELLYHGFDEFCHANDQQAFTKAIKQLDKASNLFKIEVRLTTKNGENVWLSWNCSIDAANGLIYASAINITESKKLRELNRQANTLARIGSWEVGLEQSKVYWSEMVHKLHETDPNTYVPDLSSGINFFREDFRELVSNSIDNSIATGAGFDFEAVIVTQKRKEIWVRSIGEVEMINGVSKRIFGSLQDITDRKESELRFQSFADNLPGVAFQYYLYPDGSEALRYMTRGAKKIYGFSAEVVMQDPSLIWNQIQLGGDLQAVKDSIADAIESKSLWSAQWHYLMPKNELRIHYGYGLPQFLADGTVLFNSLVLDITDESKNEELLQQATKLAKVGSWELDLLNQDGEKMYWSPMVKSILEVEETYEPSLTGGIEFYVGESKGIIQSALEMLISEGKEFDLELPIQTQKGNLKWISAIGKCQQVNGKVIKIYGSFQDIHSSKSLEIKLQEILGSISDAFYAVDSSWRFTYFNKEAERLLNRQQSEVIGEIIWEVFPHAEGTDLELLYNKVVNTNTSEIFEYFFPGDQCWYEVNAYPSAHGGVSVYFKNINERKQAAATLAKAYKEKNEILESIGDGFFSVNQDWEITYWNIHAENLMEKKREEVIGANLWEVYPDAVKMEAYKKNQYAMANRQSTFYEEYYPHINLWFALSVYPSENGLSIFFKDITLKKTADIRLLEANERFEIIAQATNDAIWDWNIMQNTIFFGEGYKKLFGYELENNLSTVDSWIAHIHPGDVERIESSINAVLKNKEITHWGDEYRYLKSDGDFAFIYDKGMIIRNKEGQAIRMLGAMSDFTQLKKQEAELLEINQSLENYSKELERSNEELEQFAFITSHDLQEPLRMISSFMDQLKRKYSHQLDEKALQYIHFATDGAKRMKQIILDLLLYSRANTPSEQLEEVNLNEIVSEYTQLRRKLIAEKNASITFDRLPVLETYRAPITQILHCLVDNSLRYVKENTAPRIKIHAKEKATAWEFAVEDNGIGIDRIFHEKIFVIFQRLHNRTQHDGNGIGLSIAKRSVEFLGGEIWLESTVGEGSTFYFTIAKNKQNRL